MNIRKNYLKSAKVKKLWKEHYAKAVADVERKGEELNDYATFVRGWRTGFNYARKVYCQGQKEDGEKND
jgi:hypothetical protein